MDSRRPVPASRPVLRRLRPAAMIMVARCLTALVGGYAATAGLVTLLARLLPIDRAEATSWGMLACFLIYAGIGLWSFHEQRLARVAAVVWGIAVVTGVAAWLLGVRP